jgi:hypothetical protein
MEFHPGGTSTLTTPAPPARRVRFMPPAAFLDPAVAQRARALPPFAVGPPVRHPSLLMSGCADWEYSYDAHFNGRPNGAFTRVALDALREMPTSSSYREWWQEIRNVQKPGRLPSVDYPQTPMLYGTTAQKNWRVFE